MKSDSRAPAAQADPARDVFDDVIAERDALQQQVATLQYVMGQERQELHRSLAHAQDALKEVARLEQQIARLTATLGQIEDVLCERNADPWKQAARIETLVVAALAGRGER